MANPLVVAAQERVFLTGASSGIGMALSLIHI